MAATLIVRYLSRPRVSIPAIQPWWRPAPLRTDHFTTTRWSLTKKNSNCQIVLARQVPFRYVHCSAPTQAPPALLVAAFKPLSRLAALLVGRRLRLWYQNLPEEEQQKFINKVKKNQHILIGVGAAFVFLMLALYEGHLQTCPVTGRKKFVALTAEQTEKIAKQEFSQLLEAYENQLVSPTHPAYARVVRVSNRLLKANADLEGLRGKDWTVTVVDDPSRNAFVLPVS